MARVVSNGEYLRRMRLRGPASEEEMIAVFLRGELDSGRYGKKLRTLLARDRRAEDVLRRPDLGDVEANAYRRRLLEEHRAYERRDGLFGVSRSRSSGSGRRSSVTRSSTSSTSTGTGGWSCPAALDARATPRAGSSKMRAPTPRPPSTSRWRRRCRRRRHRQN